ncbi:MULTISPECIES: hypothetical protein [Spirulina sp. CCY15215]|uniref:hypothetical protein n=1 Tax=Spirulina sp. CCY15215 TaxID=2767591 RepID=UPI00194E04C5|nr:hypothetical protein [Spirulina major]
MSYYVLTNILSKNEQKGSQGSCDRTFRAVFSSFLRENTEIIGLSAKPQNGILGNYGAIAEMV